MSQITYKPTPITGNALVRDFEHAQLGTMAEVWEWVVARYGARSVLGTRDVAGEEDEIQCNGTVFKKLILGEYQPAIWFPSPRPPAKHNTHFTAEAQLTDQNLNGEET